MDERFTKGRLPRPARECEPEALSQSHPHPPKRLQFSLFQAFALLARDLAAPVVTEQHESVALLGREDALWVQIAELERFDAGRLIVVDDLLELRGSNAASVQMVDDPTNSSSPATPTSLISLFATNSTGLQIMRQIWWGLTRSDAVGFVEFAELTGSPN